MNPIATSTLTPNIGLTAAWAIGTSANTPRKAPNGKDGAGRYLTEGERYCIHWPVWKPSGDVEVCLNFHLTPAPGYEWDKPPQVSPVHVEWATDRWHVHREYGGQVDIACPPQADGLGLLSLDLTVSRTKGDCHVYWNGQPVDSFGVGPTLSTYPYHSPYLMGWQGAYNSSGITAPASCAAGLAMYSPNGGTFDQALADAPLLVDVNIPDGRSLIKQGIIDPALVAQLWHGTPTPPTDRFAATRAKVDKFRKGSPNIAAAFDELLKALG